MPAEDRLPAGDRQALRQAAAMRLCYGRRMLKAVDHVVIAVSDLEVATRTYTVLLGRRPSWRGDHPALGTANSLFRLENTYLELLAAAAQGPLADRVREHLTAAGEGPFALALATDDAAACAGMLRARGLAAEEPAPGEGRAQAGGAVRRWRHVLLPPAATRGVPLLVIEHLSSPDALPTAAPDAPPGTIADGVDHVVVLTPEPDAARALYGERLGLRLALDRAFPGRGVRLLFFRLGGITVELAARTDASGAEPGADRLWGISYRVGDIAAARRRLVDAGFDVSEVRPGLRPGTTVCTVRRETHGVATLLIGPAGA
jgi:catechol 2,3-dioxygenase-like lactoylglutathione lyase family enzyme